MRRWYDQLPIHRKLVAMALVVTTAAVSLAVLGLILVDLWRYRTSAENDTRLLASVIAENTAAAVVFGDADEAEKILATAGVPPAVRRACLYREDKALFARYERSTQFPCEGSPQPAHTWSVVTGISPIFRNARPLGVVYVERELSDLWTRVWVAIGAGLVMLVMAGAVAVPIANRLHRRISTPIEQLAAAARTIGGDASPTALPPIDTGLNEIGELVRVFSDMLRRVGDANEALRRKESEREELLRREREASRLKDEFLAAVSHELRTPLNAIVGWVQVLATMRPDAETTAKGIASIARNAKAQTRVIDDLVDVSRIVAGKLLLKREAVDLREVVEAAVDAVRSTALAKAIALSLDLPHEVCLVNGDRERLQQVLSNLLSNAVKFTGSSGAVSVRMAWLDGWYEVRVSDNGIGIDADFLPYVFDRFRQADGTLTREHGGLGLGLAIVKELTALHGGTVSVASQGRGSGAAFTVRVPALLDRPQPTVVPAGLAVPGPTLAGVSILAVDDNPDALEVLEVALTTVGAKVRTATSGAVALALAADQRPDVLLCDLAMPDMDGIDVLRHLRARHPHAAAFPAIALSAHATAEHLARSRTAGFQQHLVKPCPLDILVAAIASAVSVTTPPSTEEEP
jgi:signal transduction histidine kinase/ActR/RegA family two-component response regulator